MKPPRWMWQCRGHWPAAYPAARHLPDSHTVLVGEQILCVSGRHASEDIPGPNRPCSAGNARPRSGHAPSAGSAHHGILRFRRAGSDTPDRKAARAWPESASAGSPTSAGSRRCACAIDLGHGESAESSLARDPCRSACTPSSGWARRNRSRASLRRSPRRALPRTGTRASSPSGTRNASAGRYSTSRNRRPRVAAQLASGPLRGAVARRRRRCGRAHWQRASAASRPRASAADGAGDAGAVAGDVEARHRRAAPRRRRPARSTPADRSMRARSRRRPRG